MKAIGLFLKKINLRSKTPFIFKNQTFHTYNSMKKHFSVFEVVKSKNKLPSVGAYSSGTVICVGNKKLHFFSGQIPLDANNKLVAGDILLQGDQVMANIVNLLK